MKLITAIIQPAKFKDVKDALARKGVTKMTVSNVSGCGQQAGYGETYRGQEVEINLLKKVILQIAVNTDFVEPTIQAIIEAARTNNIGDGKIFVTKLDECIRIRTGERGKEAIG
ncbi:MAG: P-II family nitrogen regulator [Spirochaetia bacterium]|nr:P-II family nitrogen regulator [Spirochaetia bacterium]